MTDTAIQVNELSKRYRIGVAEETHDTLVGGMLDWMRRPGRNFRRLRRLTHFGANEDDGDGVLWALYQVRLEVKQGEILGVIGRNGAGKSTLLKILSRITLPTKGRAELRGRVSSLLEVGTGFHPELTGRENIFLNGTILGMRKKEIDAKFSDIVQFSGVGKFLDTPVKRYSSGMAVRLAFSVAAHLEPEILLVDEVLAVGDAEFQKKCLGKMEDVGRHGRTVMFVSHNLGALQRLCTRAIVLETGRIVFDGNPNEAVRFYLSKISSPAELNHDNIISGHGVTIKKLTIAQDGEEIGSLLDGTKATEVTITYELTGPTEDLLLGFDVLARTGELVFRTYDIECVGLGRREKGAYESKLVIPSRVFQQSGYVLELLAGIHRRAWISKGQIRLQLNYFQTEENDVNYPGVVVSPGAWEVERIEK